MTETAGRLHLAVGPGERAFARRHHRALAVLAVNACLLAGVALYSWKVAAVYAGLVVAAAAGYALFYSQHRRELEEARRHYRELYEGERVVVASLQQAQTLKDDLISVVGHEFRTPLTSILGFARTLEARIEDMDADAARTSALAIQREAKRLTRMVANLLTASEELRPIAGDRVRLADVAAEVCDDVLELASSGTREITLDIDPGHCVAMSADAAHLLLLNLLDNAAKFADRHTGIRLATRTENGDVVIEVTNFGPPIDPEDRERIFDAFTQGDSSETRRYGGIGMGLHIARKVVQAHGGHIGAYSDGRTIVFRVWLPAPADSAAAPVLEPLRA